MQTFNSDELFSQNVENIVEILESGDVEIMHRRKKLGTIKKSKPENKKEAGKMTVCQLKRDDKKDTKRKLNRGYISLTSGYGEGNVKTFYLSK